MQEVHLRISTCKWKQWYNFTEFNVNFNSPFEIEAIFEKKKNVEMCQFLDHIANIENYWRKKKILTPLLISSKTCNILKTFRYQNLPSFEEFSSELWESFVPDNSSTYGFERSKIKKFIHALYFTHHSLVADIQ